MAASNRLFSPNLRRRSWASKEILMRPSGARFVVPGLVLLLAVFYLIAPKAQAIPAFSRQYQTSCSTCHIDFPKLNDFGKAFKDAGFKFPKDDETYLKVPAT